MIVADPDTAFRGNFEEKVTSLGVMLEFCPAEAHWMIGMVERRNSILRLTIEKLTDQFGISTLEEVPLIITSALHAANSSTFTRGRTAYQAVFGRIPRMPDAVLANETCLASSSDIARMDNPAAKADMVSAEAIKHIVDLNVSKQLRRALLRKTQNTRVPELQPGQQCAFWRWTKRGLKKRGGWVVSRFLSWDPSYPNKMAWIKSGTTTLVTAEQLRPATGFEHWTPSREDIAALKEASKDFSQHMLEDQTGPAPVEGTTEQEMTEDHMALPPPPTPSMMVPATPLPTTQAAPSTPSHLPITTLTQQNTQQNMQQNIQATTTTNIQVNIDSPTHQQRQQTSEELVLLRRFGDESDQPSRRGRSRTPTSRRPRRLALDSQRTPSEAPIAEQTTTAERTASAEQLPLPTEAVQTRETSEHTTPPDTGAIAEQVSPTVSHTAPVTQEPASSSSPHEGADPILGEQQDNSPRDQAIKRQASVDAETLQQETPEEAQPDRSRQRTEGHPSLMTLFIDDNAHITRLTGHEDGSQPLGYGPPSKVFFQAYAQTEQRQQDIHTTDKQAEDSDSTQASEESEDDSTETMSQTKPQGITRQERKQLDRELPWSQIAQMPAAFVGKFLAAIEKEFNSWCAWQSVLPLTETEAQQVFQDRVLSKRILRSRAAYRDKNCGQGEVKAKCRIVALGHQDPDLYRISRDAPTPGRASEHLIFAMAVAGMNRELLSTKHLWQPWLGDAQTAFLQGRQPDSERPHALYLKPPKDPLILQTSTWQAPLYKVLGNIYGLPNAPYLWIEEIVKRLFSLGYIRHAFDVTRNISFQC